MNEVETIMVKDVATVSKNDTAMDAVNAMSVKNVSCVVVIDGKKPIGILTAGDVERRLVADKRDYKSTKVNEIMTSPVITIKPETNIIYAGKLMRQKRIKKMPVEKNGMLAGIITQSGVLDALLLNISSELF